MPMPTVAAGGTSATAIMTPTSAVDTPDVRLTTPAAPAPSATTSERKSGESRSRISGIAVTSVNGGTRCSVLTSQPNRAALATESASPTICSFIPRANSSLSSSTVPTAEDIAGPTSGAMTIDPTTTAGESINSPAAAMTALMTVMPV